MNTQRFLSSVPYFPDRNKDIISYNVSVYADMAQAQRMNVVKPKSKNDKPRKEIEGFSPKSRKRMIEFLAKVEEIPDLFVTLTYADDVVVHAINNMHRHFEMFRKRLERAYAGIRAIWRIELVPRKSGRYFGTLQPHFHLLIWLPKWLQPHHIETILRNDGQQWREGWHEIIRSENADHLRKYGCQVQKCRSRKHAYSYASKYMAKTENENEAVGRRWGRIGKFDIEPLLEAQLTTREYIHLKRMLNAYLKAEALKAWRLNQQNPDITKRRRLSYYMKFYHAFTQFNINTGSTTFGLGYMSQEKPIGHRTYIKMLYMSRYLAKIETFAQRFMSP